MAIEKKLIHFGKLVDFETQLTAGNILDYSIVFIQDAKKIWTHGTYYDCSEAEDVSSISWDDVENKPTFATVATSGSYNDLSDKPTIPSAVTVDTALSTTSTNPAQNKVVTAGINAKYTKPSTGIPKSDLASAVQTSLGKADTALQSETYTGTITQIKANGTSIATSGVANIPAASTSAYGVTKLSSSTSSTSTTLAATSSAVKAAYDLANSKQATLVSGTNIKTINGTSLLGSGNITIEGGSGGGSSAYSEVSHGTSDTTFTLTPNVFHVWDEVASLTLTLGDETAGVANEFLFQFNSGSTATTLTLPDTIKWANDSAPTIEANMIYQISILKGLASVLSWENVSLFPAILVAGYTLQTHIDIFAYLDAKYGKVDSEISEDIQLSLLNGSLEEVTSISYGSYGGYSGFWLNGYKGLPNISDYVLMQDGKVTTYVESSGGGGA